MSSRYRRRLIHRLKPGEWVETVMHGSGLSDYAVGQYLARGLTVWQPRDERSVFCIGRPLLAVGPAS